MSSRRKASQSHCSAGTFHWHKHPHARADSAKLGARCCADRMTPSRGWLAGLPAPPGTWTAAAGSRSRPPGHPGLAPCSQTDRQTGQGNEHTGFSRPHAAPAGPAAISVAGSKRPWGAWGLSLSARLDHQPLPQQLGFAVLELAGAGGAQRALGHCGRARGGGRGRQAGQGSGRSRHMSARFQVGDTAQGEGHVAAEMWFFIY